MYIILFILCASPSLLNPLGVLPLWLLFSFFFCLVNKHSFSFLPFFRLHSFSFLLIVLFSFLVNTAQSKIGHLIAYLIFFCCSIPFFNSIFRKKYSFSELLIVLRLCSYAAFATVVISVLIDYFLLAVNINYAEFIPAYTNSPVISLFYSRPRGFFPEPTEAAMALNAFFMIFVASNSTIKTLYRSVRSSFFMDTKYSLIVYIVCMFLLRSAAAFLSIILALVIATLLEYIVNNSSLTIPLKIPKSLFISFSLVISVLVSLILRFYSTISSTFSVLFLKILLNPESKSASARSSAWMDNFSYYIDKSDLFSFLFGFGPGHVSYLAELDALQGSTNWYLDILIGFGILGLLIYIIIFLSTVIKSFKIIHPFRFWYLTSILAIHIHLFTNTGFYFPILPFLISLAFLPQLYKSPNEI